jgi:ubiquinone/menaquinone biosynthesis C-methylase UbiE
VTERAVRAASFGAIAEDYDRLRPQPVPAALDWLVPPECRVAVDLAAGTGLLTRALAERVPEVIAVEPDERMRAVLSSRSPDVRVLDGRGESIPLPDQSADALFVSSAWHWMDPEKALPEIARVVRPGGRFGVLGTSRDRTVEWLAELGQAARGDGGGGPDDPGEPRERLRRHVLRLPDESLFHRLEEATFTTTVTMATEDLIAVLATYSAVIVAPPEERDAHLDRARTLLAERFPGATEVEVPMRTWCWRADRVG